MCSSSLDRLFLLILALKSLQHTFIPKWGLLLRKKKNDFRRAFACPWQCGVSSQHNFQTLNPSTTEANQANPKPLYVSP